MEKTMELAHDASKTMSMANAIFSPVSTKLSCFNPAVKFDGNFLYVWAIISLSIFLAFLNHLYSFFNKKSNRLSILWNRKQEDKESDDEEVEDDEEEGEDDEEYYEASDKEDFLTEQEEKDKENEKHIAEGKEKIRKLIIEADKQKNYVVLTDLTDLTEEELEEWKNQEWKKYMSNIEEEWQLLNLWIEEERQNWIDSKDKELENWMNKMENKWMDVNNINKEYQCVFIKSCIKGDDQNQIKEQLKHELKNFIYRDWKKWLRENESYLNTWLIKQWIQWKNNKILKYLMAEWKHEEDEYWNDWEKTETWKWLHFNKRKKWQAWKNRVTNEKQEWDNWVKIKEQLVIYNKYKKFTLWVNAKKPSINQWAESLADKCVNDSRWDIWINEKYNEFMLEQKMEKKEKRKEKKKN
ncbi:tryptophan-rich antigen [Plasmodium cynomolgi strain B]|uniref:Tryptophan-rich antigen n=1 Tax=Plasmodium cynomolgi (strain B) TaxID=1120755 RepID=K6UCM2_PLACD|nr:tryptophan-rich antigen [Plasmodium cynomolgi strain B]GAB65096.1 tryptophan-rich antigen [Plasmodium cynomolgi strain B]